VDKEDTQINGSNKEIEETQFTTLYKTLKQPMKLPKTMSDNLSVPLAFIGKILPTSMQFSPWATIIIYLIIVAALLHLCNEESLHLIPSEQMDDFKIVQG